MRYFRFYIKLQFWLGLESSHIFVDYRFHARRKPSATVVGTTEENKLV